MDRLGTKFRNEVWRSVPNTNKMYEVSNFGRVRSWNNRGNNKPDRRGSPKYLKCKKCRHGYKILTISKRNTKSYEKVHRLVARLFLGEPPKGKEFVLHKDDDPSNNHVDNLYYGDATDNMRDRARNSHTNDGHHHGNTSLVEMEVKEIRCLYKIGVSVLRISKWYNIARRTVYNIINRDTWQHVK